MELYTLALGLRGAAGDAALFANRAAAYVKLSMWDCAETDCSAALEADPASYKSYVRRAAARLQLGKWVLRAMACGRMWPPTHMYSAPRQRCCHQRTPPVLGFHMGRKHMNNVPCVRAHRLMEAKADAETALALQPGHVDATGLRERILKALEAKGMKRMVIEEAEDEDEEEGEEADEVPVPVRKAPAAAPAPAPAAPAAPAAAPQSPEGGAPRRKLQVVEESDSEEDDAPPGDQRQRAAPPAPAAAKSPVPTPAPAPAKVPAPAPAPAPKAAAAPPPPPAPVVDLPPPPPLPPKPEPPAPTPVSEYEAAVAAIKEAGNMAFKAQQYVQAARQYSDALELAPDLQLLYINR